MLADANFTTDRGSRTPDTIRYVWPMQPYFLYFKFHVGTVQGRALAPEGTLCCWHLLGTSFRPLAAPLSGWGKAAAISRKSKTAGRGTGRRDFPPRPGQDCKCAQREQRQGDMAALGVDEGGGSCANAALLWLLQR